MSSTVGAIAAMVLCLFLLPRQLWSGTRLDDTRHQLDSLARVQESQRAALAKLEGQEAGGLARLDRLEAQSATRRKLCRQLESEILILQQGELQQAQELELSLLRLDSLSRSRRRVDGQATALRQEAATLARRLYPLRHMDGLAIWLGSAARLGESRNLRLLPWLIQGLRQTLLRLAGTHQALKSLEVGTAEESAWHRDLLQQKSRDKTRAGAARQEAGRELGRLQGEEAEQAELLRAVRRDRQLAAEQAARLRRAGEEVARQMADLQQRWAERDERRKEESRRQSAVAGRLQQNTAPVPASRKQAAATADPSAAQPRPSRSDPSPQPTGGLAAQRGRLPAPVSGRVSRPYGSRQDAALGTVLDNPGMDYSCAPGSPVHAVHEGRVEKITWVAGFGNTVLLSHGKDCWTVYAKLDDVEVREGQAVRGGQSLGKAGRFDSADQGAVHFELWQDRQARDPRQWLRP